MSGTFLNVLLALAKLWGENCDVDGRKTDEAVYDSCEC